ncbi:MAG: nucleotidyltransferase domain-containing protein [Sarcina sp.]
MFGLKSYVVDDIKKVLEKYTDVEKAMIFGSRATERHKKTSDIDIAIFSKNISNFKLNLMRDDLDMLDIIYKIDLVHFDNLKKQGLIENIEKDGIEIYRR